MTSESGPGAGCCVSLETLGCKLNQAESEALARDLERAGCRLVPPGTLADVFVVNTCSVTHVADRKSRQMLRQARRLNPGALVVALGCYVERAGQDADLMRHIDLLLTGEGKGRAAELLMQRGLLHGRGGNGGQVSPFRTRSLVKVQEGCNSACAYCVVPRARGPEQSRPLSEIVAEVTARAAEGYQEVVLTGTNVGRYAWAGADLACLVSALLERTAIDRLRLSSLQPPDIAPALIDLWGDPRLCRHVHLPLQSGSDAVLHRMGRSYTAQDFSQAVARLRQAVPDIAITSDVMVAFPGESQAEFQESYAFCREMGFAGSHVFPYSLRQGTPAAQMPGQVTDGAKAERKGLMLELAQESARGFRRRFLGRSLAVLWETQDEAGIWSGLTDNYIRVFARRHAALSNRLLPAHLMAEQDRGLWAEPGGEMPAVELQPARLG